VRGSLDSGQAPDKALICVVAFRHLARQCVTRNSEQQQRRTHPIVAYPALARAVVLRELLQDALLSSDRLQIEVCLG